MNADVFTVQSSLTDNHRCSRDCGLVSVASVTTNRVHGVQLSSSAVLVSRLNRISFCLQSSSRCEGADRCQFFDWSISCHNKHQPLQLVTSGDCDAMHCYLNVADFAPVAVHFKTPAYQRFQHSRRMRSLLMI